MFENVLQNDNLPVKFLFCRSMTRCRLLYAIDFPQKSSEEIKRDIIQLGFYQFFNRANFFQFLCQIINDGILLSDGRMRNNDFLHIRPSRRPYITIDAMTPSIELFGKSWCVKQQIEIP